MQHGSEYVTHPSLLLRLQGEGDEADWEVFYHRYARFILAVAMRYGLQPSQADDLLQETMVELIRVLQRFQYDRKKGTFRGFLRTIVMRKVQRVYRQHKEAIPLEGASGVQENLLAVLEDERADSPLMKMDDQWREAVLEEAIRRLQEGEQVPRQHIKVLVALLNGEKPAEIESRMGVKANAIYQMKHRLVPRLRAEVEQLMEDIQW